MAYHVEVGGPAHLYASAIPTGATAVGVIRTDKGNAGALIRFRTGAYAQMNDAGVRPLDRKEVVRAMSADCDRSKSG